MERPIIITVDRQKISQIDELLESLKAEGLEIDDVETIFDVTQIHGRCSGDIRRFNRDGVTSEQEGWRDELGCGQ